MQILLPSVNFPFLGKGTKRESLQGEHAREGLGRHAAVAVIGRCAGLHRAEPHLRQTVLEVITKGLLKVSHNVLACG